MSTQRRNLRSGVPLWQGRPMPGVPNGRLSRDVEPDILVVGAGISGALVAEALSAEHRVVVVDRRGPVKGSTAASTALIEYEIDTPLIHLAKQIGLENAQRAWRRTVLAINALATRTRALRISCDLQRRDSLYLAGTILDTDDLRDECAARRAAGLETTYLSRSALKERFSIARSAALLAFDDFSADPRRLAAGYLRAASARGVRIFSPVDVIGLEASRDGVAAQTAEGPVISARHAIYCTGYELPETVRASKHQLSSTYAFATRRQTGNLWPERCLIWEASDPYLYVRDTRDGRVLCGGGDEEFADAGSRDALIPAKIAMLGRKLSKKLLPDVDPRPEFAWAGTFGSSETGLLSIGRIPGMKHCWAVLGFGGNGITYSRIAADIIRSALAGDADPDADLYAFG